MHLTMLTNAPRSKHPTPSQQRPILDRIPANIPYDLPFRAFLSHTPSGSETFVGKTE